MKRYFFTLFILLTGLAANAQNESATGKAGYQEDDIQTLFNNPGRVGWWVSPDFSYTRFETKDVFLGGISG